MAMNNYQKVFVSHNSARLLKELADIYKIFALPRHPSLGRNRKVKILLDRNQNVFVGASRATALSKMGKLSLLFQLFPTYYHQLFEADS